MHWVASRDRYGNSPRSSRRDLNADISLSSSAPIRDTSNFEIPDNAPSASMRSSTFLTAQANPDGATTCGVDLLGRRSVILQGTVSGQNAQNGSDHERYLDHCIRNLEGGPASTFAVKRAVRCPSNGA